MSKVNTEATVRFALNPDTLPSVSDAQLQRLRAMRDDEIDFGDMPTSAKDARWVRPGALVSIENKQQVTLRLDSDVLTFFKGTGKRYQSRINAALRNYLNAGAKEQVVLRSLLWLPEEPGDGYVREEKSAVCATVLAMDEKTYRMFVAPVTIQNLPPWSQNLIAAKEKFLSEG